MQSVHAAVLLFQSMWHLFLNLSCFSFPGASKVAASCLSRLLVQFGSTELISIILCYANSNQRLFIRTSCEDLFLLARDGFISNSRWPGKQIECQSVAECITIQHTSSKSSNPCGKFVRIAKGRGSCIVVRLEENMSHFAQRSQTSVACGIGVIWPRPEHRKPRDYSWLPALQYCRIFTF